MGINNKWTRGAIPALLIHCSIGSVYCWSLFVNAISEYINKSTQQVQFSFSLAIFFLGISAAFGGKFVETNVKKSTFISMICFCGGLFFTALSIYFKSLIGIYVSYGCLMGIGLGIGYIAPVKTLMLWFKSQKGLATGLAITGFGLSSAIASPLITILLKNTSLPLTFFALGIIYLIPIFIAFILIKKPNEYIEQNNTEPFKLSLILKNKTFIFIWIMIFLNISCGLSLISIASPLMKELKISTYFIVFIIGIMGISNGSGRLIFSALSDKMKNRRNIYVVIFLLSMFSIIIALFYNKNIIITLVIISACYGAGFSNLPSLLSDKFGMSNISKIHGLSLTAWAMAGLTGNQISSLIKNITGRYINVLWVIIFGYAIALIICLKIKNINKEEI